MNLKQDLILMQVIIIPPAKEGIYRLIERGNALK
jgi:hypothetical protein